MILKDPSLTLRCAGPLYKRHGTTLIIIHSITAKEYGSIEDLNEQHISNGWSMLAYNYIIDIEGNILQGRPDCVIGMHCIGYNNVSIGIAVCLNSDLEQISEKQKESLVQLSARLCKKYNLKADSIVGHSDKNSVSCPAKNLYNIISSIQEEVLKLNS